MADPAYIAQASKGAAIARRGFGVYGQRPRLRLHAVLQAYQHQHDAEWTSCVQLGRWVVSAARVLLVILHELLRTSTLAIEHVDTGFAFNRAGLAAMCYV
jgi:hypothetical protein